MFGKNMTVELLTRKGYEIKFGRKKGSAGPKGHFVEQDIESSGNGIGRYKNKNN